MRTVSVWQQLLEACREDSVRKDFVLPAPHDQGRQPTARELLLEPIEALRCACGIIEWNPARPGPGEQAGCRLGQHMLVRALRAVAKFLPIDHRQIDTAARERIMPSQQIRTDQRRVHGTPRKNSAMKF